MVILLVTVTVSQSAPLGAHVSVNCKRRHSWEASMLPRSALRRAQTDTCTRLKGRWKDLIEVAITANDDLRGNVANETEIDDSREDVGKKIVRA